jgi:translocation and assembly module TamB
VFKGSFEWPAISSDIDELRVTPALIKALTGSDAVRQPIVLTGNASVHGADVKVEGGAAKMTVKSTWDLGTMTVSSLELNAVDVDLSEWLEGGASSRLSAHVRGSATDLSLEKVTADLTGKVTWQTLNGATLAEADLQVGAQAGQVSVKQMVARVPGASVSVSGNASLASLSLSGTLDATNLSKIPATVQQFTGVVLPPLQGEGSVRVQISGPTRRPKIAMQGTVENLRIGSVSARTFGIDAVVPDVTHPLNADGTVTATTLVLGSQSFDEVRATLSTHGRDLEVSLATRGLGDVGLHFHGRLDADNEGLGIEALTLTTSLDRWVLERPTHLSWGRALRLEPVALSSGQQALRIEGTLRGEKLTAELHASSVDLARLPKALAPQDLQLAGVVTLDGTIDGPLKQPNVIATAQVHGGAVKGITRIEGEVDARFVDGRLIGTAKVSSSLGGVDGRFDVPVFAVLDKKSESLEFEADIRDVSLEAIQSWRGVTWPVTGTLGAHAVLKGPSNDPSVSVTVRADSFTMTRSGALQQNLVVKPVQLTVASDDSGALKATLSASTLGADVTGTLGTSLTVPGLRAELPTVDALKVMKATLDLSVAGFSLETLKTLGVEAVDDVSGRASFKAALRGSFDDPTGQLTLRYEKVNAPPLEDLDGEFELTASETLTRLSGKGRMQQKLLFDLSALIDTPVKNLEHVDTLGAEHVTAHLSLAPIPLARLLPKRDDDVPVTGAASLDFDMKGSLADPKLTIDGTVQNLSFGRVPLGQARLVSRTQGNSQVVGLTLRASGKSELRATGTVGIDLALDTLRRGVKWASIPVDLSIAAKDFDLGFLSGVTPVVRTIGGNLSLQRFKVTGPLGNPDVQGDIGWTHGRLALASYGDYRDITLQTSVTRERIEVQTFSARAGGGGFVLNPSFAQRQATGVWTLKSSGSTTRFPLVVGDQLLAIVGMTYTLDGELSDTLLDVSRLELPRVAVELPELRRKNIQDLERPTDFVLVRGGQTIAGRPRAAATMPTTGTTPSRTYRAAIIAPRNIWVRSSDLNLELGLSEGFRLDAADAVQLFGQVNVLGGRIDVIGREFTVSRSDAGRSRGDSTVVFAGPALQPYVNVTAVYANDREKVKVTVSAVGRGTDVVLKVSADPPMSESDIYTLLATGRRDLRRSSGASVTAEQAVSMVGSLAASQLKNELKKLPIDLVDVLSIDTGTEGLTSTRVKFGKYLSDSLYLGYTFQPGANQSRGENTHAGRLEYQVSKDVSLEATAGTAPAFGADVVWSHDY